MNNTSTGRRTWLTRIQAALLTLAVLNVTVAPCAMAFDEGRHCPNCPPEREHEMAGHHGHGKHQEAAMTDCESLKAQCGDLDDLNIDLRSGQTETDAPQLPAAPPFPATDVSIPRVLEPLATGPPPCLSRGSPRLHELHCVYRD